MSCPPGSAVRRSALLGVTLVTAALLAVTRAGAGLPGRNGLLAWTAETRAGYEAIFRSDAEGHGVKQLTLARDRLDNFEHPAWSPDGRHIAFDRPAGGGYSAPRAIFVMNADGTGQRRLTADRGFQDSQPAWSPGGRSLVFVRTANDQAARERVGAVPASLGVVSAPGGRITTLTKLGESEDSQPKWSPDGSWIAFVRTPIKSFVAHGSDVYEEGDPLGYLIRSDGTDLTRLGANSVGATTWSPDGKQLAYSGVRCAKSRCTSGIFVGPPAAAAPRLLVQRAADFHLSWSPDGKWIAADDGVFVSATDGSVRTVRALARAKARAIDWQPVP